MNKHEIKYIIYSSIFAIAWFFVILPFLVKTFDGNSPVFQFFAFNLGLYLFFFIFLKSLTLSAKSSLIPTLGLLCLFIALDVWLPEYHVATTGELIKGGTLGVSTSDYFAGFIASNYLGLKGILVYLFTYIAFPIVLLITSAKLLPNFVRRL